jgi:hypothetical protein
LSMAKTVCLASEWISDSTMIAKLSPGTGHELFLASNYAFTVSSVANTFSFDCPLTSSLLPMNAPTVGANEFVFGFNFGMYSVTPGVKIGKSLFLSAVFLSDSSIFGKSSPGSSGSLSVFVSVSSQTSVASRLFSYNFPKVSAIMPNSVPTSSLIFVTLIGFNFGPNSHQNDPAAVKIGVSDGTVISRGTDHSFLVLRPSSGSGISRTTFITVNTLVNSLTASFSYNAPTITAIVPSVVKNSGSVITITGTNFGTNASLIQVQIASLHCNINQFATIHLSLICSTPFFSSSFLNAVVSITVDGQLSRVNSTIHVTGNGTSQSPALWCGALMFAWGFGSGTYFVDPDAEGTISSQSVYCAVLPDGSSGWTKMLQYDRNAYSPTASAVGTISTSSISSNAKLADFFINALVGNGKSKEYRFRASSFTTSQHVPEQDLFVVSSALFEDIAFGQVQLTYLC